MKDFIAFRTLWNAIPMTEEAYERNYTIIDGFVRRTGKSFGAAERALALYKLKMETKEMRVLNLDGTFKEIRTHNVRITPLRKGRRK